MSARPEFQKASQCPVPTSFLSILVGSIATALLIGCGAQRTPEAILTASSLTFAAQLAGTQSSAQAITLSNPGNAPLAISGVSVSEPNLAVFSQTSTCGSTLPAGGQCTLSVKFAPTAQGSFSATLTLSDNAAQSTQVVALSGTGIAPLAALGDPQITFPATNTGYVALPQSVRLTNTGTAPLLIGGLSLSGAGASSFRINDDCGTSLAPAASCSLDVTFNPSAAGTYSVVLSDAAAGTQTVLLTGTGSPDTPLSQWHNALLHCHVEPVNILVLGDSRSIVDTTIIPPRVPALRTPLDRSGRTGWLPPCRPVAARTAAVWYRCCGARKSPLSMRTTIKSRGLGQRTSAWDHSSSVASLRIWFYRLPQP